MRPRRDRERKNKKRKRRRKRKCSFWAADRPINCGRSWAKTEEEGGVGKGTCVGGG